jgi:crotonobetainyl-CoA:carnitine CoA-transferase CaiB-like acyl-CoA transferase
VWIGIRITFHRFGGGRVTQQALAGLRVLDVTQVMAGPFCTMLLADMGADVLKVEPPSGDSSRKMAGGKNGNSPAFQGVNRGKRGIILDLKSEEGRDEFRRLAAGVDVLVENYRPGVMADFGLGYEDLKAINPGLIYCSISGFGLTGPYQQRGGFDLIAQGMTGIMSITGEPGGAPVKCGLPITDLGAGLFAIYGILAAYTYKLKTGKGQLVDTSLVDAGVALSIWEAAQYFSGRGVPEAMGSAHRMTGPYQAVRCADGYLNIGAANPSIWVKLAGALGLGHLVDQPAYQTDTDRVQNRIQLAREIEAVTLTGTRADWMRVLDQAGVPCGPILTYEEVFADPHIQARNLVVEVEHPVMGAMKGLGAAVKLSETPADPTRPAPILGQHNGEGWKPRPGT